MSDVGVFSFGGLCLTGESLGGIMRRSPHLGLYILFVGGALALYFPVRVIADRTNATMIGSDNFALWWATLLWPCWSFTVTFVAHFAGTALGYRLRSRLLILPLLVVAWFLLPSVRIPVGGGGGGDLGIRSFSASELTVSTTSVSFLLCPLALVGGIVAGEIVGARRMHQESPGAAV